MNRLSTPILLITLALLSACGGYASNSEAFRRSMRAGSVGEALTQVNDALGVDRADQLPTEKEADTPLLLLERATILQAMGRYKESARDFQVADKSLDVLDLTGDALGSISKYLFSDDAKIYKSPPHEKLLLNTLNMVNYLAMGDASGAKVEARRLVINQKYLDGEGEGDRSMLALSSYLAGFAFESANDGQAAMRHYADAHAAGGVPGLDRTINELHAWSGATDGRVKALYADDMQVDRKGTADVLVLVQTGMAPFKVPERLPVAQALVISNRNRYRRHRLSAADQRRASRFAAKGLVTWVNFPRLRRVKGMRQANVIEIDKRRVDVGLGLDVERRAIDQFERLEPSLIAASLTRMLARAAAGALTESASKGKGKGSVLALLAGLAVQGTMAAMDTPDTRSWVTLPGRIYVARARVKPGEHTINVRLGGINRTTTFKAKAGGFNLINFSATR